MDHLLPSCQWEEPTYGRWDIISLLLPKRSYFYQETQQGSHGTISCDSCLGSMESLRPGTSRERKESPSGRGNWVAVGAWAAPTRWGQTGRHTAPRSSTQACFGHFLPNVISQMAILQLENVKQHLHFALEKDLKFKNFISSPIFKNMYQL